MVHDRKEPQAKVRNRPQDNAPPPHIQKKTPPPPKRRTRVFLLTLKQKDLLISQPVLPVQERVPEQEPEWVQAFSRRKL